jgi:hypothetical protein
MADVEQSRKGDPRAHKPGRPEWKTREIGGQQEARNRERDSQKGIAAYDSQHGRCAGGQNDERNREGRLNGVGAPCDVDP